MPKRFTDSDKWKKEWFSGLSPAHKCLWYYILDTCSTAGIWDVNWRTASFQVGAKLDPGVCGRVFRKQFQELDGGRRWFIRDYVEFQYGQLSKTNPAHKGALKELQRYSLIDADLRIVLNNKDGKGASEPLPSSSEGAKDKDKGMDKDKGKVVSVESKDTVDSTGEIPVELKNEKFGKVWAEFREHRRQIKKPLTDLQGRKLLSRLARSPSEAVAMLEQSIENGWQGVFDVKANGNGHESPEERARLMKEIADEKDRIYKETQERERKR